MEIRSIIGAAIVCTAVGVVPAAAQSSAPNMRQFAGTHLNLFYSEMPFMPGLKKVLPEFEKKTGITVNIELMSEGAAVQKTKMELAT